MSNNIHYSNLTLVIKVRTKNSNLFILVKSVSRDRVPYFFTCRNCMLGISLLSIIITKKIEFLRHLLKLFPHISDQTNLVCAVRQIWLLHLLDISSRIQYIYLIQVFDTKNKRGASLRQILSIHERFTYRTSSRCRDLFTKICCAYIRPSVPSLNSP